MKKILLVSALAALTSTSAFAGGLTYGLDDPEVLAPAADLSWTGLYAGVSLGSEVEGGANDASVGVHLGYRYDLGNVVLGAEGSYATEFNNGSDDRSALEASAGYDFGDILTYGSVGYAWDNGEGAVYGVGADYRLDANNVIGVKATYDDFGTNEVNVSARYSFQF